MHPALTALAARLIGRGVPPASVETILCGLMESCPEAERDARWHERRAEISRNVESAVRKFRPKDDASPTAFSACASTLMRMSRKGHNAEDMQTAALGRLAQHGIEGAEAERILHKVIDWCQRALLAENGNG
jgi:hypothetical protein